MWLTTSHRNPRTATSSGVVRLPEAITGDERHGKTERYSWRETLSELEVRVHLPLGTKRNQLQIVLLDAATQSNLWLTEIETAGGEARVAERALLRVRPLFWSEPLLEGVLRGGED